MKVFMGTLLALTTTLGARRFFLRFRPDGLDNQGVYAPAREIFRLLRFRGARYRASPTAASVCTEHLPTAGHMN